MRPFFKTSALCLLALCGLQSATAAKLTFAVSDVGEDAYTAANLARNGELSVHISPLQKSEDIVTALKAALRANPPTGDACASMALPTYFDKVAFHARYTKGTTGPNYRELFQTALTQGTDLSQMKPYPTDWEEVWNQEAGANLAYLLWSTSTEIGCATATCKEDADEKANAVLYCQLVDKPKTNGTPFTEEYYKELMGRKVPLSQMKEDELEVSAGASSIAAPSGLLASLVAIMATIAA
ncbi:SAG family member [Eimeria maxima]|uniref:SAG family member n=1 Tax=Eimeria maxima TaxID=5804 RepID=U6M6J8_EIMMA|nr:SAG family member [Eimeria maxima]CDJ59636.1 SAG family member [Eimeria maxima]